MSDFAAFVTATRMGDNASLMQADALVEAIPAGTMHVMSLIEAARQTAVEAGLYVRSAKHLAKLRELALWAGQNADGEPDWVSGISFWGHLEAKEHGFGIHVLRANPQVVAERKAGLAADKAARELANREAAQAAAALAATQAAERSARQAAEQVAREAALQASAERQTSRVAAELLRGPSAVAAPPQPMGSWTQSVEAARVAPVRVVSGHAAPVIESAEPVQHSVAALILMSLTSRIEREGIQTDAETLALVEGLRAVADRLEARMLASR